MAKSGIRDTLLRDTPKKIYSEIIKLLDNKNIRLELGDNGNKWIKNNLDVRNGIETYINVSKSNETKKIILLLVQFQERQLEKIKLIINEILVDSGRKSLDKIGPELSLMDDIGLDSLDLATLTVRIEDEFGVDIFENGIVTTVKQIIDQIEF